MKPFDPDSRCPKCGGEDVGTHYSASYWDCLYSCSRRNSMTGEHMERTCRRCGYRWVEAPLGEAVNDGH